MINTPNRDNLQKIVILNPKGGSGKTTLATNLASFYARRGPPPTLMNCDPQGYSMRWLEKRGGDRAVIYGVSSCEQDAWENGRLNPDIAHESRELIVDLPAAIAPDKLYEQTYDADSILIPVLPSEIDIHSAAQFIAELLLIAQIDRRDRRLAIVANRTRKNTLSLQMLTRFLSSLQIPLIAQFRDSQNFVTAAAAGIGICEMPVYKVKSDLEQLNAVVDWLDQWRMRKSTVPALASTQYDPDAEMPAPILSSSGLTGQILPD